MWKGLATILVLALTGVTAVGQERPLVVAATTSVQDSGLLDFMLPKLKARTGVTVRIVSRATAQALMAAERGLVDVVIVNDAGILDRFVDKGDGTRRHKMMFNDFVIVGPKTDPAGLRGSRDAPEALRAIALKRAPFVSRGDDSGTHLAEMRLWQMAGVNPKARSGNWYRESGLGMGLTVTMAARLDAYALTDRSTWAAGQDHANLEIIVQGDPRMFNQYEIILVNPAKHPHVDVAGATSVIDWIVSDEGQAVIADYKIGGHQVFFPNAKGQN